MAQAPLADLGTPSYSTPESIVVRYADYAGVRCDASGCAGGPGTDVSVIAAAPSGAVSGCYGLDQIQLDLLMHRARAASGRPVPDLSQCLRLAVPASADSRLLLETLLASDGVEDAYLERRVPLPVPPQEPSEAPDLSARQWHLGDRAAGGLNVRAFWDAHGVYGEGVRLVDIEVAFDPLHEDLGSAVGAFDWDGTGTPQFDDLNFVHHAVAAFGMIIAQHNGFGVDGIAPAVAPIFASQYTPEYTWGTGAALARMLQHLVAGDVVLLEVQVAGPRYDPDDMESQFGLLPAEFNRAEYDIIRVASDIGVVIVEAAGNGAQDLDDPIYEGRFDREARDSGALVVCASNPPSGDAGPVRAPAAFTNRGSRCDLQGYGYQIVTTGYGDLRRVGNDPRQAYTSQFGGTSGASPMVAGVAALLQSLVRQDGDVLLPEALRAVLVETGLPQSRGAHIGPLPDALAAAAMARDVAVPMPEPPGGTPGLGQRCEADCAPGATCVEVRPDESYCLALCTPFAVPEDCGDGSVCQLQIDGSGSCVFAAGQGQHGDVCDAERPCAVNHTCGQDGVCYGLCSLGTQSGCRDGHTCAAFDVDFGDIGYCLEYQRNPDGAEDGAACDEGFDCQGGYCVTEWPDGYCLDLMCGVDADCHGENARCVRVDLGGTRYCFAGCERHADCRFGYACDDGICQPGGPTPCVQDADCPPGAWCPDSGVCREGEAEPEPEPEREPEPQPDVGAPDTGLPDVQGNDSGSDVGASNDGGFVPPPPRAGHRGGCL